MLHKCRCALRIFFSLVLLTSAIFAQKSYIRMKTGIHFDSSISGGKYNLEELTTLIARSNLDAAIITDHDNMEVSYGLKPLQRYLKYTIRRNSVKTYGVRRYFGEIESYNQMNPDVIIIPGIEAVPFYYWEGSMMNENLYLKDWHTHLLVFGMDDITAYENLPSLANGIGYHKPGNQVIQYIVKYFTHFFLIGIYMLLFILAFFSIIKKKRRHGDIAHIRKGLRKYRFSWKALLLVLALGFLLKSEYPFLPPLYDQYHGDQDTGPYQALIDYVNEHNGMVFWAHPEVTHEEKLHVKIPLLAQDVKLITKAYPQKIVRSNDYTGYAIFWEGMKSIGRPGGLWDLVLEEYCHGIRQKPVYAIGELDFEESNNLDLLTETNTFVFAKSRSQEGVLEAIRAGRMYATRNFMGNKIAIDDFTVHDNRTRESAFIGETLENSSGDVSIHIRMAAIEQLNKAETVRLYRNKQLIRTYRFSQVLDTWHTDTQGSSDKVYYYRLIVGDDWPTMGTNPVFVSKL